MKTDEIQNLTFTLCANSPRTLDMLALPVVVRNADLLAQRGRYYSDGCGPRTVPIYEPVNPKPLPVVQDKVFYC